MTSCVVQLHLVSSVDDAMESIELIEELYSHEYEIFYSIQASQKIFKEIEAKLHSKKIFYLGEQKRTVEECMLFYAFSGFFPEFYYDPKEDVMVELKFRHELLMSERVKREFDRCSSLKAGDLSCSSALAGVADQLNILSSRASRICYLLNEEVLKWRAIALAESSLIRGMVSHTLAQLSASSNIACGSVNNFDQLLQDYRVIEKMERVNRDLINDRKSLIIALGAKNFAHDKVSLINFLLVNSSYCFSISQYYIEGELNLSGLFLFRSFELLVLSSALERGVINYALDRSDGVQFRNKDGSLVSGVGGVWHSLGLRLDIDAGLAKTLGLFIVARNKSFLGHGFVHLSKSIVKCAQGGVYNLLNDLLNDDQRSFWLGYKSSSRVQCLKDFLPINGYVTL